MPRANEAVSDLLLEFADLLSILSGDPFKPRAYEKAAQAVSGYAADVSGLDLKGILAIPSVGKSIGEKVHEYLTTGAIAELDELRAKVPAGECGFAVGQFLPASSSEDYNPSWQAWFEGAARLHSRPTGCEIRSEKKCRKDVLFPVWKRLSSCIPGRMLGFA